MSTTLSHVPSMVGVPAKGLLIRRSQVRTLPGTALVHQLYTSAGRYGKVHLLTPSAKPAYSCGFMNHNELRRTCQISLVKRRGQRFESACRLFIFPIDKPNTPRNGKAPTGT